MHVDPITAGVHADLITTGVHADLITTGVHADLITTGVHVVDPILIRLILRCFASLPTVCLVLYLKGIEVECDCISLSCLYHPITFQFIFVVLVAIPRVRI